MAARRMIDFPFVSWQNPFATMDQMARQMDALSNAVFGRPGLKWLASKVFPAVNITEDGDKYYVRAELPGIRPEDLNVEVTGRNLTISGERKIASEGQNIRYHRKEREAGRFSRAVELPGEIDGNSVNAKLNNGVLMIEISKSEASKPRKIMIQ